MSTRLSSLFALPALVLFTTACNLGLDPPTFVKTPRILAIVAEPPEAPPGQDVAISVMAFDPMGRELTYAFEVCFDPGALLDSDEFDPERAICFPLESDGFRATLTGDRTLMLDQALDALTSEQTQGFDPDRLREILRLVGIALRIQVDVLAPDGTILVEGHKLVGITTRASPTTNPPAPYLLVEGMPYVGGRTPDRPFDCVAASPAPFPPGANVALQPGDDPALWIETYPTFDFLGGLREGREGGYYSWYATGGSMPEETTQYPSEGLRWQAPMEEGFYRIWYVVRDGHLGTSACTFELEIRAE